MEGHGQAETYEEQHVHSVYEEIASHFSSTRYKPWPLIERFLHSLPAGAVGVDVGCGNGKYLPINRNVFVVASDRSTNLVRFAKQHVPHSAVVADCLDVPHPANRFDFAISIAVIHHLSTRDRRVAAVHSILAVLRQNQHAADMKDNAQLSGIASSATKKSSETTGGRALLYVWALEQKSSRRGWDEGHSQDVMVPWVLKSKGQSDDQVYQRYYHLYRKGELEEDIVSAGGVILDSGYEKDNWWAIAQRADTFETLTQPLLPIQ